MNRTTTLPEPSPSRRIRCVMLGNLLLILLLAASIRVWIRLSRRWRAGESMSLVTLLGVEPQGRSPYLRIAWPAAAIYVGMLAALQLFAAVAEPDAEARVTLRGVQASVFDGLLVIVIALGFLTGLGRAPFRECGFDMKGLARQLRAGAIAFLASFAPVFALLLATFPLRSEETLHPFLKLLSDHPDSVTVGWVLLAAVVIAPVKEELLFRVMLQNGLARRIGPVPAIGIVAVLFCAVHGFPDSLALFPLAVVLGALYHQTQSAFAVITTHALFNLSNLAMLLLGGPA